jgi:hypothetical protein
MRYAQRPRDAFGEYSDCRTGTVEFVIPSPTPAMILATIMWALVYAVACSSDPMDMMITPTPTDFLRPSRSPKAAEASEPMKAPTSKIETMRPSMVGSGSSNVFLKAGALTRPPMRPLSKLQCYCQPYSSSISGFGTFHVHLPDLHKSQGRQAGHC